ncbi:ABC transporter ATP-binding protein [Lacticaseibacillus pabuli]|uniref:ABC transporter ATP-binding protein n=1 Tax=Lacticaseibacillus pabuli TaxID=3025672 RepID=A0ABY7WXD3_9LACO|nr:ABC transporter ATP-binding protein [Lacticaseibacillus sp. KACC 23028]WDF83795.1 ABC transporter ATP-binding protein [Lacticaseibacillus sp. KACC 23028]
MMEARTNMPSKQSPARPEFKFRDFFKLIAKTHPKYWQLITGLVLGLIATGAQLIVPQFASGLINRIGKNISPWLIGGAIALFILSAVISAVSGTVLGFFGEDVVAKLRGTLWGKALKLPVSYFDEKKSGEVSSRLVNDSTQVKDLLANSFPSMITSAMQLVGALVLMLLMDWKMTAIMFVAVPLFMLIMMPISKRSRKVGFARQEALANFTGESTEILGELRLVKSSNAEAHEEETGNKEISTLYQVGLKEAIYDSIASPILQAAMMGLVIGVLAYGASRVMAGTMTLGTLVAFLMYLFQMMGPAGAIGRFATDLAKTSGSTQRIAELLDAKEEDQTSGVPAVTEGQTLKAEHLDFAYRDDDKQILHDVSFTAAPNQIIAFAGPSGGGKSTIFALLERFYKPTGGKIMLGDTDAQDINLASWRQQIGLVSQDSPIMAGTIRYNLTYGLDDSKFSDDDLWRVLQMAYADDFVRNMPNGLDTQVGERGVKVSGGQRQRIAIARAFLRDPKILMLDEATASLDSESEMMVQKALDKLLAGRTTLVIAHRLSTIVDADEIYFIENGAVSGHGKHQELVKSHPLYREYVENQMRQPA